MNPLPRGYDALLAEQLSYLCGDVNDGHQATYNALNVSCRVLPPGHPRIPASLTISNPRAALVVFAGSNDCHDWLDNLDCKHIPTPLGPFHEGFERCFERILPILTEALAPYSEAAFTGHSHGGPLACRSAEHFRRMGYTVPWAYTLGSPRPASKEYRDAYRALGIPTYRIVVDFDGVPRVPDRSIDYHLGTGVFFTEDGVRVDEQRRPRWWAPWRYLTRSVFSHLALASYSTALRRFADS